MTPAENVIDGIAARVLAVDVDELTLGRLKVAVRGTEFAVEPVPSEAILAHVESFEGRLIVLLEWTAADDAERHHLCEALFRVARADRLYIVALGGPADHAALLSATDGAADDALSRPFASEILLLRLRQAVRFMRGAAIALSPRSALDEALEHGNGEVCVRSGDTVARIHLQDGHIVWASVSSAPARMEDVVAPSGVTLDPEMITAVKQECRSTGAHFMDVLVKWGLIDRDRAREALRSFVTDQVDVALALPDAAALFLPKARGQLQSDRLRFRASEIPSIKARIAPATSVWLGPESRRSPMIVDAAGFVATAMEIEGAIAAAVLERGSGACLSFAGADMDTQIAWSQVSALAALGPSAEEVIASAGDLYFVTRALRGAPSLALFVVLSASATSLGLSRAAVSMVAARLGISSGMEEPKEPLSV